MKVTSHRQSWDGIHGIVNLRPGMNEVNAEEWARVSQDPEIAGRVKRGEYVVEEPAAARDSEATVNDVPVPTLEQVRAAGYGPDAAARIVAEQRVKAGLDAPPEPVADLAPAGEAAPADVAPPAPVEPARRPRSNRRD